MTRDTYAALQLKIQKEITRLQKQAQALQSRQRTPVIASIVRSMREYDISPDEIAAAYNKKKPARTATRATANTTPKRTVPPKYRNPETGATWTGRGKAPRWVSEAEAQGKSRDQFLIKQ
ncbi:MAG TPA: H-NS histone family protein [Pusillimonas sp.]|uniref:H-NS histone family protein n=1 Tax=Pusillimonas sp. TaxID=3040095 RepID=UPI002CA1D29A|nr:H-NS histone family protein [Pusillimonas sp.]HUH86707.1 H-NS histone family protein [Pusillimonas sp.]